MYPRAQTVADTSFGTVTAEDTQVYLFNALVRDNGMSPVQESDKKCH
jgi:hypothetical protein